MKKILILLLYVVAIQFASTSCSDDCACPNYGVQSESFYYTIYKNQWELDEPYHWFRRLVVPEVTIPAIDRGAVLVYFKNGLNTWVLLPYSTTLTNSIGQVYNEEIWSGFALGTIDIDYVYTNSLDPTPPDKLELKVVVMRY